MRGFAVLSAVALGGLSMNAFAACEQPSLVLIPAEEDMAGQEEQVLQETQEYFQAMQAYVDCIMGELDAAGEDASDLYRNVLVQRNNAAVAEAEAVQQWFESRFPGQAEGPPEGVN